jgi:hypothetical protein
MTELDEKQQEYLAKHKDQKLDCREAKTQRRMGGYLQFLLS